ncbi:MAG: hypothetical protein Q4A07_13380, partial [Coriobacteriales bacterium]|nr:hypothetical protein [Coriobacteriales bacterium]
GSVGCSTWSLAQLTATALLLIHSVMEFDLQFAALSCMLAFLLCEPRLQVTLARIPARGLAAATASAVTCALCATGVVSAATTTLLAQSNARGAFAQTERIFWTNPLAMADPAAQDAHVEACFKREDYKGVCTSYELMPVPSDASVLYAATAMHAQGNRAGAAKVLAERLMATPYDEGLLESAKRFANTLGVESSQREQFDAAIARSEDLITKSDLLRARESSWAVADGVTKEGSK